MNRNIRKRVYVYLPTKLVEEASEYGLNLSAIVERALRDSIKHAKQRGNDQTLFQLNLLT